MTPAETVRAFFAAYHGRDQDTFRAMMTDDFRFSSPHDPDLDKTGYFERCWAPGDTFSEQNLDRVVENGDEVFVRYEVRRDGGERFRNAELITTRDGQIARVEVYYGATF
jgi:ketosteroid isomerase-like protein